MPDTNIISKIKLPDGKTYSIKDANVGISSEYHQNEYEVELVVGSLGDADSTEY